MWAFSLVLFSDNFETMPDNNVYGVLCSHTGFSALNLFLRTQGTQGEKVQVNEFYLL